MLGAKPAHALTSGDFAAFPIWEWAIGEEGLPHVDETWVRPVGTALIPRRSGSSFLVAATAVLKDGTKLPACIQISRFGKLVDVQPLGLFVDGTLQDLEFPDTESVFAGRSESAVYPIRWTLAVAVEGERRLRRGTIRQGHLFNLLRVVIRLIRLRLAARGG